MASDYGPEIKASISQRKKAPPPAKKAASSGKESPADKARDVKRGIPEGSKQDQALDAQPANQMRQAPPMAQQQPPQHVGFPMGADGGGGGAAPDHHRVAMASSIAHAILGRGGA